MGDLTFTRAAYSKAFTEYASAKGPVTAMAEQIARATGELNSLVDPAGYDVIRESRPRFEQLKNKLWQLTVGTPVPIETRLDTTGSMGSNVDIAIRVLPSSYEFCSSVLPGCDPQLAIGIFGDIQDRFVLCRPQFEMEAQKIVEQLTLMVPERAGGDAPEDPHYGLFGAAYLTATYLSRIGLKGYDFTVSDAPARHRLDERQLVRIFGDEVFNKVAENGHQVNRHKLPTTEEVVQDLLKIAHAFFLQVGESNTDTTDFWTEVFGEDRVVILPSIELLPQVQATIIGLTEGTLNLQEAEKFLKEGNVSAKDAKKILRSVANIPIGAQAALPNFKKRPQKGDLFKEKTDLWPISKDEIGDLEGAAEESGKPSDGPDWL